MNHPSRQPSGESPIGIVPTNDVFANLVSQFSTDFGATWSERLPATGYDALNATAYMMQSQFELILSPGDQVNGGSVYEILPEPASLTILAAGMLLGMRRRRA